MSQRSLAAAVAAPLVLILLAVAALLPLPYTIYRPGPSLNVLTTSAGEPIVTVKGHKSYHDDGALRMTTVRVTGRDHNTTLVEALWAWVKREDAIYPSSVVYPDAGQTAEQDQQEGQVQMATSQETAVAVALEELGYDVERPLISEVADDMPASGILKKGDVIVKINTVKSPTAEQVVEQIVAVPEGDSVTMVIERNGKKRTVEVAPVTDSDDGMPRIGVGLSIDYEFPFEVDIDVDPNIGGPSAGLIFSLAVYDTLTPGSLTGGQSVAGTGEINPDGSVGAIGGIQQKIAGASQDGAKLFLVPADNWDEAQGADAGDMRIAEVATMSCALEIINEWVADPNADLVCEQAS